MLMGRALAGAMGVRPLSDEIARGRVEKEDRSHAKMAAPKMIVAVGGDSDERAL